MAEFVKSRGGCIGCPLENQVLVPPEGELSTAKIILVGQNPGPEEREAGRPFVGPCGRLLFPMLEELTGLKREDCYITNSCKCTDPQSKESDPPADVFKHCGKQWVDEWGAMAGKRIVLLGGWASRRFFRSFQRRGLFRQAGGAAFLEVYHPAWVLYGGNRDIWKGDLALVNSLLRWSSTPRRVRYSMIPPSRFDWLVQYLTQSGKEISFDVETNRLSPYFPDSQILCISFYDGLDEAFVIDWSFYGGVADYAVKAILEASVPKIGQNAKFDIAWLRRVKKIEVMDLHHDPMIASFILSKGIGSSYALDHLIMKYMPEYAGWGAGIDFANMAAVDKDVLHHYNAVDAYTTWHIAKILEKQIKDEGMEKVYYDVLMPAVGAYARTEDNGLLFNRELVEAEKIRLTEEKTATENRIKEVARSVNMLTDDFNVDALLYLRKLFFDGLKLAPISKTKKGSSQLNVTVLEQYAKNGVAVAKDVLKWRSLNKSSSTYYDNYIELLTPDGLLHPAFNFTVAVTGRLSCWNPNMQNVPNSVRKAFVSRFPGGRLMQMDFKQIEMRLVAIASQDEVLLEIFQCGEDPHAYTASQVTGLSVETILRTKHPSRQEAKVTNFSLLYGGGPGVLIQKGLAPDRAVAFYKGFFERYAGVERWQNDQIERVRRSGFCVSPLGRVWNMNLLRPEDLPTRALNYPIQSTASDITLYTHGMIDELITGMNLKTIIIANIHDALLFDCPGNELMLMKTAIKSVVASLPATFPWMICPMDVEITTGLNWGELEEAS